MLRALTAVFRRLAESAQLSLELDERPRTAQELLERLRRMGLRRVDRCRLTTNRTVMVSYGNRALRLHEGYLAAPDLVLQAVVVFVEGRTRGERLAARQVIVAYPIEIGPCEPIVRERMRPEDEAMAAEFAAWHREYNRRHFDGRLAGIPIRISWRMRSRLGHYTAASPREPAEIAISLRHVRRHGVDEALHTLLHEMVHQWQDECGHAIDHGTGFRAKAREVGIAPSARRTVRGREGRGGVVHGLPRRAARRD